MARLGGDELGVLCPLVEEPPQLISVIERLRELTGQPFEVDGQEAVLRFAVGVAATSPEGEGAEPLLRDAATALDHAKQDDSGYAFFAGGMHDRAVKLLELDRDLRRGIEAEEFVAYFQPIISAATRQVAGYEALARWHHPERGVLSPFFFIERAEQVGLIEDLGWQILQQAARRLAAWRDQVGPHREISMAVNISPKHLMQPGFVERLADILRAEKARAQDFKAEITESVLLSSAEEATSVLEAVRNLGVTISLDDFGTGYSSLSYLHRLPVDIMKIDRSFVDALGKGQRADVLVRASLGLAASLDLSVVAEGVETIEQWAALDELGCQYLQGYYFSKPVPPGEAAALLDRTWERV